MTQPFIVAGIGELLWDVFPEGKRLGGAPVNFCYHCDQLGATGYPVSAVGADPLGTEIRAVLQGNGIVDRYIAEVGHPTGTVQVMLKNAQPTYEICEGVAWDHISVSGQVGALAQQIDAVGFGSLAQRSFASRSAIHAFLERMKPNAFKIFDVNLRQTFFSREIIESSLEQCNILKLSDEELPVLAELFGIRGAITEQLQTLRTKFGLTLVAYTRGPGGSLLVSADETDDHPGRPVEAINTVGAGDSFAATLCMGLLNGKPLAEINDHANRVAAFVCTCDGATPILPRELVLGATSEATCD
ncbi:Fructokinase [Pontiella desulfatans]|uniref:Fructokinase n=1 Tax=Pontiella desulfatans TaxID=2750659 RepID=A0A6C2TVD7_PONDE|nr:carbohydrate kinase [Pontiella desulfatans]VGO11497.1 Fructokinase [Pontiella desulfatans]